MVGKSETMSLKVQGVQELCDNYKPSADWMLGIFYPTYAITDKSTSTASPAERIDDQLHRIQDWEKRGEFITLQLSFFLDLIYDKYWQT